MIWYRYSPFGYQYACKGQGSGKFLVCMLRTSSCLMRALLTMAASAGARASKIVPNKGAKSPVWDRFGFPCDVDGTVNNRRVVCRLCKLGVAVFAEHYKPFCSSSDTSQSSVYRAERDWHCYR